VLGPTEIVSIEAGVIGCETELHGRPHGL
jgi:hypothetical protein